ncbi:sensor histidine kinase [Maribacter sp. X9]|uniref:sensor histidine kinase n=1 Tax=Maribacter sp. X9 TaxID=3402159 RepID=UPI003AF3543F
MAVEKNSKQNSVTEEDILLDVFGLITLISTSCAFVVFLGTVIFGSFIEQLITFVITIGFGIGLVLNRLNLFSATRIYMTTMSPTMFGMTICLVGGFFGQGVGIATMTFLTFIVYRENPKLRIIIMVYDVLAFILPTIYITMYGPLLGTINLPYDEIVVFIASLAWLSLTFLMYDETKTRTYTNALEKNNKNLISNEIALKEAQSNLKDQNKKLSILNHELSVKNKQIEEFTFIVTHDLKTPLSNINSIAKELQKKPQLANGENLAGYLKHLQGNSFRMTNLVHSLLEYAEIGNSNQMRTIDCREILEQVLSDLSEIIKETKAIIKIGEMPKIVGSEREIRMLFQNLLDNALKFRSTKKEPIISIHSDTRPGYYMFSIEDNGIGIPEIQKGNIFNAFHRLHNQSEFSGSGIGLYSCKRVIDLHKGRIWVESEENEGSTFNFTISSNLTEQNSH